MNMGTFDNLKGKVSGLVDKHGDKISDGVDKAGEFIDSKTGGKHADKIATGKDKLKGALDGLDGKNDDFPDRGAPAPRTDTREAPAPPTDIPPQAQPHPRGDRT